MRWLRQLADDVAAAFPDPDEANRWIMEILTKSFEDLADPGPGKANLDAKLKSGVKKIANHGQIATDIDQMSGDLFKEGKILRGRQIVHKIMQENMIDKKSAHLFGFNDLNKVKLINGDLRGLVSSWETTLARCQVALDEESILHPMFFKLIENHPPLAEGVAHYKRMDSEDPNRSYGYLLKIAKKEIENDLLDGNRATIQAAIATGGSVPNKGNKMAVLAEEDIGATALPCGTPAGKGDKGRNRETNKGTTFDREDASERGLCFAFQTGNCKAVEGKCPGGFKHELAKKKRHPTPPPTRGRGKGGDTSKIPCRFFANGNCIWGDGCTYSHIGKGNIASAVPAAEDKQ
jgi:hypothetical protein